MTAATPSRGSAGRGRGVAVNLVLSILGQVVAVAGQLLVVPFFLRAWGDAVYGDWLTLSALSSYLSLTDMGMQLYVINRLTGHEVRGQKTEFSETLQSALLLYAILSSIALVALSTLTFALPWRLWFSGRAMSGPMASETVALLGISSLLLVWCGFFGGMHRIYARPQKTTALALAFRSALLVTNLVVLGARRGPVLVAVAQVLLPFAFLVGTIFDLKREHPALSFGLKQSRLRCALAMLAPSALFAVFALATGLSIQGTLLVTSSLLGPAAVTGFATSRTVASTVRQVVSLLNNVAWPEFTRLEAAGESRALSSAYRLLLKAGSLLATWMVCSLWFTGPTLYAMWTRGRAEFDPVLFRLLLVDVLLQTPSWAAGSLLASTNRHRALTILYVIQGVLAVTLSPVAIKIFGVVGVGIVLVGTDFPLFGFLVPSWAQRVLGEKPIDFFVQIYGKLAVILAVTMGFAWAGNQIAPSGLVGVVVVTAATLVPIVAGGVWWLHQNERELALSVFLRRASRR